MKESRKSSKRNVEAAGGKIIDIKSVFTTLLVAFILFSLVFLGYKEVTREDVAEPQSITQANSGNQTHDSRVVVYYLHGTFRCPTCLTIEQYSREAVEFYFPDQLREGKLEFIVKNFDELENRHFIKDYKLYAQSLVIVLYKDGKQMKWKNLERVWDFVDNRDKFYEYVKQEIEEYLREVP